MTKEEYQKQNDEMRGKIAAYEELGTPEQIKQKIEQLEITYGHVANEARATSTTLSMIKKLLA